jgi:hypothetical protein
MHLLILGISASDYALRRDFIRDNNYQPTGKWFRRDDQRFGIEELVSSNHDIASFAPGAEPQGREIGLWFCF